MQDVVSAYRRAFKPEYQKAAGTSDTVPADAEAVARYDSLAHPLSSLQTGTPVRVQNDRTKLRDRSGVVVDFGPHQKYFIYLPSGRILTRHHPFLHRRYNSSLPPSDTPKPPHPDQKPPLLTNLAPSGVSPASGKKLKLRRLSRESKKPDHLIEHDDI